MCFVGFSIQIELAAVAGSVALLPHWIKNKERPLGEIKWAWYRKSRGEWAGPCGNLHTWVGPSFLRTYSCSLCNQRRTRVRAQKQGHRNGGEARGAVAPPPSQFLHCIYKGTRISIYRYSPIYVLRTLCTATGCK